MGLQCSINNLWLLDVADWQQASSSKHCSAGHRIHFSLVTGDYWHFMVFQSPVDLWLLFLLSLNMSVWMFVCVYVCVLPRRGGILLRFPPSSPVHLKQSSSHVCHLPISLPLLMLGANLQLSPGCWTKHVSATVLLATIILPVSVFCGETLVALMLWSWLKSLQFVL